MNIFQKHNNQVKINKATSFIDHPKVQTGTRLKVSYKQPSLLILTLLLYFPLPLPFTSAIFSLPLLLVKSSCCWGQGNPITTSLVFSSGGFDFLGLDGRLGQEDWGLAGVEGGLYSASFSSSFSSEEVYMKGDIAGLGALFA